MSFICGGNLKHSQVNCKRCSSRVQYFHSVPSIGSWLGAIGGVFGLTQLKQHNYYIHAPHTRFSRKLFLYNIRDNIIRCCEDMFMEISSVYILY